MKILRCLIISFGFVLMFSNLIIAQIEKAQTFNTSKIAKIDSDLFNNKEHGIKALVKAENSYSIEYYAQFSLRKTIDGLKEEIDYLLGRNEPINNKYLELQKITAELNRLNTASDTERERKYSIVVAPIINRIKEKIKEFAKLKGYILVLDKYDGAYIIEDEIIDATAEFIKFCNKSFDEEKL